MPQQYTYPQNQEEWYQRARNMRPFGRNNPDGSISTHLMAAETDGENWYVFPTLFPRDPNNTNPEAADWDEIQDRQKAFHEARKRGEIFEFGADKDAALRFSKGEWKPPTSRVQQTMDQNDGRVQKVKQKVAEQQEVSDNY